MVKRRHAAKTGFKGNRKSAPREPQVVDVQEEEEEDVIAVERSTALQDQDDEQDEDDGVFNLDLHDNEDDEDEDDEEDAEELEEADPATTLRTREDASEEHDGEHRDKDDEDDVEENEQYDEETGETDLERLLATLPANLRNPVPELDNDEIVDIEPEETHEGWGKSKALYYHGDTADLEIGQEIRDAEDEEEAARELRRTQLQDIEPEDYMDQPPLATKPNKQDTFLELESNVFEQKISREGMSKQEKLKLIQRDSPELIALLGELKGRVDELKEKIVPVVSKVRQFVQDAPVQDEAVKFMEVKQQVLMSYCLNMVFYMLAKVEGRPVRDHPVMRQLLELRYAMEKMRPLDAKLKHQIDRLLKMADSGESMDRVPRPNPEELLPKDALEDEMTDEAESGSNVYKAPKLAAVHFEDETRQAKAQRQLKKNKDKLRGSEIMNVLLEEFGERPETGASSGLGTRTAEQRKLDEEADERRKWEEDRYMRVVVPTKERKEIRRKAREANRLETLADVGDFTEFESITERLSAHHGARQPGAGDAGSALQKAVHTFTQSSKRIEPSRNDDEDGLSSRGASKRELHDFEEENEAYEIPPRKERKRRPAPSQDEQVAEDPVIPEEDELYAALVGAKDRAKRAKKEHFAVAPRYGGDQEELDATEKRAVSYEIIKNRGLRPHKNKLNRNPRVKKREQFRKAVIRRKGQVQDAVVPSGPYQGETSGIKSTVARTRTIRN